MSAPFAPELGADFDFEASENDLDAITYDHIPTIARRWLWPGYLPFGNPVLFAAKGETGKGFLFCLAAALIALGLPFPGEDQEIRREPGRVVWIAGSEDDQFEDLAPRFRAAIAYLVSAFGLPVERASERGAIRYIHDLSEWKDGSPFDLPGDMGRLLGEVRRINRLDAANRGPQHPGYTEPGPRAQLVVLDPLADLLGEHDTIATVKGARRTLRPVKRFARAADVALVLIHHLTRDGKVAGSPAVLDALRLAFIVERREDNEDMRVITRHKGNISVADPQQYTITGGWPATHAEFVGSADERAQRVMSARERGELDEGQSVRDRIKAARSTGAEPGDAGSSGYDPGMAQRFKVIRRIREHGTDGPVEVIARDLASRSDGYTAASADAGRDLGGWHSIGKPAGAEATAYTVDADASVSYAVTPAS
jgi:hypothetical protein